MGNRRRRSPATRRARKRRIPVRTLSRKSIKSLLAAQLEMITAAVTLHTLVRELAEHAGISEDSFEQHFDERKRLFHETFLIHLEDSNPTGAAMFDARTLEECSLQKDWRPLFGPPSSDEK